MAADLTFLDSRDASKLIAFFCQHVYHDHCLQQETQMVRVKSKIVMLESLSTLQYR